MVKVQMKLIRILNVQGTICEPGIRLTLKLLYENDHSDTWARRYLWRDGLGALSFLCPQVLGFQPGADYRHGTGHGVGHFLNVHEGTSCSSV